MEKVTIPELSRTALKLEEVWKARSAGDQQHALQLFYHHGKVALLFLFKSLLTSVLSIFCIGTVLLILGILLAFQKMDIVGLDLADHKLKLSVFMKDSANEQDWKNLTERSAKLEGLLDSRRLDKAVALAELKKSFPDSPGLFDGVEQDNPLPASYELTFDIKSGSRLPDVASMFRSMPGVEAVAYDGELANMVASLGETLKGAGRFGLFALAALTFFLIATTVRLSMFHEQEQIEIMALVGAYPAFVQAPFIISGALQGLLGFGLSYIGLTLLESGLIPQLSDDSFLSSQQLNFSLLSTSSFLFLLLLAVGSGILGSYFASRHLK